MTSPYVCTDALGRGKQKRIPPLSVREFCSLLFQMPLEMIDKSESVNWPRSRPFDFWGGYEWFQKKCPADWLLGGKAANKFVGKKYRPWRIMLKKKSYTVICRWKNFYLQRGLGKDFSPIQTKSVKSPIPHSPTNVQWSCQPFSGWGKKRIWHLSECRPSTNWLGWVHHVVVFKTKVLHFKTENTPIKDTNVKRKLKGMLSFLFVDKRKLFAMKLSFEEFNNVFCKADRSAWLVLNQPRQRGFGRHLRYIPYSMIKEKYVFKREFLYL